MAFTAQLKSNLQEGDTSKIKCSQSSKSSDKKKWSLKSYSNNCYAFSEKQMKSKNNAEFKSTEQSADDRDKFNITCYNCDKKDHYTNECTRSLRNLNKISVSFITASKNEEVSMQASHCWDTVQK